MERRDFLKLASLAGLGVASPSVFAEQRGLIAPPRHDYAAYEGNLFLFFNASGGWDPTHLCDPKPKRSDTDPEPMTNVLEVESSGNISYPAAFPVENYGEGAGAFIPEFFRIHHKRLTVVNGIDMQTNGHDAGNRHTWSGRLNEGYPSIGAYLAASFDPTQPMAYLAFSGYSLTQGTVARTRAGNLGVLSNIAFPDRMDPSDETSTYHSSNAMELIEEAQFARDKALREKQGLPRIRQSINTLFEARSGSNELKKLQQFLPEELSGNGLERQAQVAIAAYKAGICISASLGRGGFDTHGSHDMSHIPSLEDLLLGIDFAWREAERQGVADKLVIAVGSDFGRTPGYNGGMGKDHWSITSMMFMGAGIPGNRVIGETTEDHRAKGIRKDLSVDDSEGARRIGPADIHHSLRKLAGVHDTDLAAMFPLNEEEPLDLFG